jgi:hypothetical protein
MTVGPTSMLIAQTVRHQLAGMRLPTPTSVDRFLRL